MHFKKSLPDTSLLCIFLKINLFICFTLLNFMLAYLVDRKHGLAGHISNFGALHALTKVPAVSFLRYVIHSNS